MKRLISRFINWWFAAPETSKCIRCGKPVKKFFDNFCSEECCELWSK